MDTVAAIKELPRRHRGATVRRNITVPKDVAEGMDGHPEINWSAVAQQAFREALDTLKSPKPKRRSK